jgi:hypothetical protein
MRNPKIVRRMGLHGLERLDGTFCDKRDGCAGPKAGKGKRGYACAR